MSITWLRSARLEVDTGFISVLCVETGLTFFFGPVFWGEGLLKFAQRSVFVFGGDASLRHLFFPVPLFK